MENYKEEIVRSRVGCLGGSDAKLLSQVASCGYVPESARKRLAIVKGLIPSEDNGRSSEMRFGDEVEQAIWSILTSSTEGVTCQSNPLWESKKYSKKNVRLICHPDYVFEDTKQKVIKVYECKATKFSIEETRQNYKGQLYIERLLALEVAKSRGRGWKVENYLVHYDTSGLDLSVQNHIDPARLSVVPLSFRAAPFDVDYAMTLIDEYLETLEFYSEDVVSVEYLPAEVQNEFSSIADMLREIKEREAKIEEFKTRLYDFLQEKGISKVKCDGFSFTVVQPSTTVSTDYKTFFERYVALHPRKGRKLQEEYKKTVEKRGYVKILVK